MLRSYSGILFSNFITNLLNDFIGVQLIYNVVLLSDVQPSDSNVFVYIYSFSDFFPIVVYYKIVNIVPCAIHVLVVYLFHVE